LRQSEVGLTGAALLTITEAVKTRGTLAQKSPAAYKAAFEQSKEVLARLENSTPVE
jgi:hypothetical protein